jgi:hypothetical protein
LEFALRTFFTALVAFGSAGSAVYAQEFPPVYVFTEDDDDSSDTCQIGGASIVAAVESELRQNQISIASGAERYNGDSIWAYLNLNAAKLSGSICAVDYNFQLTHRQIIFHVHKEKAVNVSVENCNLGGLMTGVPSGLQSRLNDKFRDLTNQCISKYLKD